MPVAGRPLNQVRDQIRQLVLQQKQQNLMDEHVRTPGSAHGHRVSASWTKEQARLARGNPVDRVRSSRRPSLVDFGSTGCVACDMLAPILETLKTKYAGKRTCSRPRWQGTRPCITIRDTEHSHPNLL